MVICLERGADCLHMVQLMPLHPKSHHLLPHLNPDWFYLSGTSLPRLSWKEVVVVVVVVYCCHAVLLCERSDVMYFRFYG